MISTEASTKRLNVEIQGPVARINLTRPPLNVIDFAMMDELLEALRTLEQRSVVSMVLLSGGEHAFSAGVDIAIHSPDKVPTMLEKFDGLISLLAKLRKITIAEVHGSCMGGGAELAMVCDLVYTSKEARWGFPEITVGCYPPVACAALSALVGEKRAADLIFTGRTISGEHAADWGLANEALPGSKVKQAVEATVDRLVRLSPAALALAKKAFYAWDSIHLDKGVARAERIYIDELLQTEDAREGVSAWMEKRKPEWKGR